MKKTLFVFVAVLSLMASCQKAKTSTNCYQCKWYKVVFSSIEVLAQPLYLYATDTVCDMNDATINFYIQQHTYYDTLKNSSDTLTFVSNSVQCNVE